MRPRFVEDLMLSHCIMRSDMELAIFLEEAGNNDSLKQVFLSSFLKIIEESLDMHIGPNISFGLSESSVYC